MKHYLDDDTVKRALIAQLGQARHDVRVPADVGLVGEADPMHLLHAIKDGRILVGYNYDDFEDLHKLVVGSGGSHPGIFVIRRDQDRRRHMSPAQIVRAIAKLDSSGTPVVNAFIILNQWQ
jgi:hypothetical protein